MRIVIESVRICNDVISIVGDVCVYLQSRHQLRSTFILQGYPWLDLKMEGYRSTAAPHPELCRPVEYKIRCSAQGFKSLDPSEDLISRVPLILALDSKGTLDLST